MHMFKTLLTTAFCLSALISPARAEYPDKPIRMVVGYAPGGAADKLIRPITDRLARVFKYCIIRGCSCGVYRFVKLVTFWASSLTSSEKGYKPL